LVKSTLAGTTKVVAAEPVLFQRDLTFLFGKAPGIASPIAALADDGPTLP
jgi:hypothetical protein